MKNLSLILNVILIAAVAFLYYMHFNSKTTKDKTPKVSRSTETIVTGTGSQIAYVDLDSLNENITFIKTKRKELEAEQKAIETEWENGYRSLENQKNNFLKKGDAITQQEAEEFQGKLIQQQQQIDGKKQNLTQRLTEKSYKFMEGIQKQLKDFLTEYNRDKNYQYILTSGSGLDYMVYKDTTLDITQDVIEGMNEKISKEENNK